MQTGSKPPNFPKNRYNPLPPEALLPRQASINRSWETHLSKVIQNDQHYVRGFIWSIKHSKTHRAIIRVQLSTSLWRVHVSSTTLLWSHDLQFCRLVHSHQPTCRLQRDIFSKKAIKGRHGVLVGTEGLNTLKNDVINMVGHFAGVCGDKNVAKRRVNTLQRCKNANIASFILPSFLPSILHP